MTHSTMIERIHARVDATFGPDTGSRRLFFAPARVNLIGEHIDYCGGLVLPAAIQFGTWLVAQPNGSGRVQALSLNQSEPVDFALDEVLAPHKGPAWGDYLKGVFEQYRQLGVALPGLDIVVGGDIPGNGLSSSASLEVAVAIMIEAFSGYRTASDPFANRQAISWRAQRAENTFVGVNCGIMDQAAIALGRDSLAMRMNCRTLAVEYVPVDLGNACLLIANTCKARTLAGSAYNRRRAEVEQALAILAPLYGIEQLCELPVAELDGALAQLSDGVIRRRVRHVVSEQQRVIDAASALSNGDIESFGRLLTQSHLSLQHDYEVTGQELDTLVGLALEQPGVLGARMTGAGFGGCALVLLEQDAVTDFVERVGRDYRAAIGYDAEFYPVQIGPGAGERQPDGSIANVL